MSNLQKFKLINGAFLPSESREILHSVYSSKIQFHHMKNFSSLETFGKEDKLAVKKIPQLKKSLAKLLKLISSAEKQGKNLEITSDVIINFVENKKNV